MTPRYNVTLINLAADARSAAAELAKIERPGLSGGEVRALLENFCALDPVQNATADPEIRVQVGGQSSLVRLGQKKLILYDMLDREIPGHVLSVDEAMAEIDGTAGAARAAAQLAKALANAAAVVPRGPPVLAERPPVRASRPRMIALGAAAVALLAALGYLRLSSGDNTTPAGFNPISTAESTGLQSSLAGVYLTGAQPGQHGIVLMATGELRLFELRAVEPPRLLVADARWGRIGPTLCLATNQPGGLITMADRDAWVYCGETYRRVP